MSRIVILPIVFALALALAGSSAAAVRKVSFTATVQAGSDASLTVTVSPAARCSISVLYDTVVSNAKGLGSKKGAKITWRWRVGSATHPGRWPVLVSCGESGTLKASLRVTPR